MNNYFTLLKISLNGLFNIKSKFSNKEEKKKTIPMIFAFGILFVYVFVYAKVSMEGYVLLNSPYLLLASHMVIASVLVIYMTMFKINGTVFNTKDSDILHSLPLKKSTILLSKVTNLYLFNLMPTALIMVPAFIVYLMNVVVTPIFVLLFILTFLIIPFFPIVIASVIGTIIAVVSSKFKNKNLMNIIFSLALVFVIYYGMGKIDMENSMDLANIGKSMVNFYNKLYPLTTDYMNIINDFNMLSLLKYLAIPSVIMAVYIFLLSKVQTRVESSLKSVHATKKTNMAKIRSTTVLKSLIKKESRKYFTSSLYFLNTFFGIIMMTLIGVAGLILGMDKVSELLKDESLVKMITTSCPLYLSLFVSLSCTTNCSISLEGKSFGILKSLPISMKKVIESKIIFNLILLIPTIIINVGIYTILLDLPLSAILLSIAVPIVFAVFTAEFGILCNILFPNLNYDNEIRVIKQSAPVFITIFTGMILTMGLLGLSDVVNINNSVYLLIVGGVMIIIDIILKLILNKVGVKKLNALC